MLRGLLWWPLRAAGLLLVGALARWDDLSLALDGDLFEDEL